MKKQEDKVKNLPNGEMKAHYDFDYRKAKPNRFAAHLAQEQLMVVLDPDVALIFPTAEAVNQALRVLAAAAQNLPSTRPKRQRRAVTPAVQVPAQA